MTYIYKKLNDEQIIDQLRIRFTRQEAEILLDYLGELTESMGEPLELDPIALAGDYTVLPFFGGGDYTAFEISEEKKEIEKDGYEVIFENKSGFVAIS